MSNQPRPAKTVQVGYAYATSAASEQFGFGDRGCWAVMTITRNPHPKPPVYLAGYATQAEGKAHAVRLNLPFEQYP